MQGKSCIGAFSLQLFLVCFFLLRSNFAKLVLGHFTCLTASHLLAQFMSTETAKKIKFLLPATLQFIELWKNGLNSVPPYALSTKKCAVTPMLYCHPGQQAIGCPSDTLHNTQVDLSALFKVKESIEMAEKKVYMAGILRFLF